MNNIKESILDLEIKFEKFQKNLAKYHRIFVVLIYILPAALIIYLYKFQQVNFDQKTLIIIYSILIVGLILHYIYRYNFQKTKRGYEYYLKPKLDKLKELEGKPEVFEKKIITDLKFILNEKKIDKTQINANDYTYWFLLIKNLNIDINKI